MLKIEITLLFTLTLGEGSPICFLGATKEPPIFFVFNYW